MERVTIRHIAETIGVSQRLVAYALTGTGRVGAETKRRILDEAQRLGYRPNRVARALATGRSGLLALCLPRLATAYGDAITRIVEARARTCNFDLVVTRTEGYKPGCESGLLPPGLSEVDGAFLLEPPRLPSALELSNLRNVVVVGVYDEIGLEAFDHVRIDLQSASRQAVQSMLSRRPRRFAYATVDESVLTAGETRYKAYMEGVMSAGLEPSVIALTRNLDLMSDAAAALMRYATDHECPDAIMCSNDEIAIGVLRALRRLGLCAPRDVSVTGCDGIVFAEDVCPPLSTIVQPFDDMLKQAWEFLMNRIADETLQPQHAVIEARFVARESTGFL